MVGYTFTSSRAGGEAAAASIAHEGVNHKWFQLDRISPAGNTLSFSLLERFGVHLRSNGERISHECNCDAHHPEGACSVCLQLFPFKEFLN